MAKEILAVPEGSLLEVIKVIRTGLKSPQERPHHLEGDARAAHEVV